MAGSWRRGGEGSFYGKVLEPLGVRCVIAVMNWDEWKKISFRDDDINTILRSRYYIPVFDVYGTIIITVIVITQRFPSPRLPPPFIVTFDLPPLLSSVSQTPTPFAPPDKHQRQPVCLIIIIMYIDIYIIYIIYYAGRGMTIHWWQSTYNAATHPLLFNGEHVFSSQSRTPHRLQ